jgi:endonuclease YncB( thermonuclease family)
MKDIKPIIFIVVVLVLTAISAYPQRKFGGKVVEVIDGKTCVIQLSGRKLTAVLQYIEIPETDQPLYGTVKEHLQNMILDKWVEFLPRVVMTDRTAGQLLLKGIDVGQQMLRDGAAWYSIPEKSGQDVWGIENLKPSWEYRAEKETLRKRQEQAEIDRVKFVNELQSQNKKPVQRQTAPQVEMWADVGGGGGDQPFGVGGLLAGYDPTRQIGHISTPSIFLDFPKSDFLKKVESRVFYLYKGDKSNIEDSVYAVAFLSTSKEYSFLKSNNLTIIADNQKVSFGKAARFWREGYASKQELLVYKMKRAQLMKIVNAQKISIQIGSYSGGISAESLAYINNLLKAS